MDPLGTNMYLLKRYRPSDSFCTFISESVKYTQMSMEATITIHSNWINLPMCFISDTHSVCKYKVHYYLPSSPATYLHLFWEKLMNSHAVNLTDSTLRIVMRTNMAAPISRYRSRSKRFTIMWGVSPQPPPVRSIHLDDATAATGQRRQCAHNTPATGGEERES